MKLKVLEIQQEIIRKLIVKLSNKLIYYSEAISLPKNTYPAQLDLLVQKKILDTFSKSKDLFKPYPTVVCPHILSILASLYGDKKFKLLDFGARNIDLYAYLNKNLPGIQYYYYDLPQYNNVIEDLKKNIDLVNLFVLNNLKELSGSKLDFIFLGSVLQYIKDYKNVLSKLFNSQTKYFLISGQVCYEKNMNNKETIFYKQLNVLPQINYGQFFHYESLIRLFDENGWRLISKSINTTDKHINFNHMRKEYGELEYLDLFFKKK